MKIYAKILLCFLLLCLCRIVLAADNFQRGLTRNQIPAPYQSNTVNKQPRLQTAPAMPEQTPQTLPQMDAPVLAPAQNMDTNSQVPVQPYSSPKLPDYYSYEAPKITVPDYEKKYQQIVKAAQEKAAKKKKKLLEALLEEIDKYGIFINILLIVVIMVYMVYKDRWKTSHPDEPMDQQKKDIWHEEF